MYIDDISSQLQVFFYSVGFGFILGFLYDAFRVFRVLIIKSNKAVFIQDISYFLLSAVITFIFLLVINNGKFRLNIFIAIVLGFIIYYLTLGRFLLSITVITAKTLKRFFIASANIIAAPYRLFLKIFGKINLNLTKKIKNIKKSPILSKKTLEKND